MLRAQDAARALQDELRAIAEKASAAVVAIQSQGGAGTENPFDQGRASGFIVSTDGHVVTDARFVRGRRRVDVRLRGGLRGSARLVGIDALNGTALLQLDDVPRLAQRLGGALPTLAFGPSGDLRLGQSVFTVSNTFDSVTVDGSPAFSWGNVTAIARAREGDYRGVVIETDAAVNPGAFGGPLLDRGGRVVGVVSVPFSTGRWLGSAIPSDQVRLGVEDLLAGKPPTQGFLGVTLRSTGGEARTDGLEVLKVLEGSPAAAAGIQPGDRLVALDGRRTYEADDVGRELLPLAPGSRVLLRVLRGSAARDVRVVLGRGQTPVVVARRPAEPLARPSRPPAQPQPQPQAQPPAQAGGPRVTLGVRTSNRPDGGGVRVVSVEADGPAARAGLIAGDVILAIGKDRVRSLVDLQRLLDARHPGDTVQLTVERDGWSAERTAVLAGVGAARAPGFLGVYLREGGATAAEVSRLEKGSPAEAAGVRVGDVVAAIDGRPVRGNADFVAALRGRAAGDALALTLRRGGGTLTLRVVLAPRPVATPAAATRAPAWFGAALEVRSGRLLVAEVDPRGPAAAAGLKAGDALLAANGRALRAMADFEAVFASLAAGDRLRLEVERGGWTKTVDVSLAPRP